MADELRTVVAREFLDVLVMNQTPDIIELDSDLKSRIATFERPWPFTSAEDAAGHFRLVASATKKYSGVKVTTDYQVLRLVLRQ